MSNNLNESFIDEEILPEEKIQKIYNEYLDNLYSTLIDNIMGMVPEFFEHLIV